MRYRWGNNEARRDEYFPSGAVRTSCQINYRTRFTGKHTGTQLPCSFSCIDILDLSSQPTSPILSQEAAHLHPKRQSTQAINASLISPLCTESLFKFELVHKRSDICQRSAQVSKQHRLCSVQRRYSPVDSSVNPSTKCEEERWKSPQPLKSVLMFLPNNLQLVQTLNIILQ